jgi:hypothetical protein
VIVYKIKNGQGLYSMGGCWRSGWNKEGKIWRTLGHVKLHLNSFLDAHKEVPEDWKVITCELIETNEEFSCRDLYESIYYKRKLDADKRYKRLQITSIEKKIEELIQIKESLENE